MTELPTDRPLNKGEVEHAVAEALLKEARVQGRIEPRQFISPGNVARSLGLTGDNLHGFAQSNKQAFGRIANTFINRLTSLGILERDWEQSDASFFRLTQEGEQQLTNLTSLESAFTLQFVEGLQDDELRRRCGQEVVRSGEPDTLVREAMTVLEDRIRKMTNAPPRMNRGGLAGYAFAPDHAKVRFSDDTDEQKAAMGLFGGVLGFFGNPFHHALIDFPAKRARQIVGFIDTLLVMLEEATKEPRP